MECGLVLDERLSTLNLQGLKYEKDINEVTIESMVKDILEKLFLFSSDVISQCTLRVLYWMQYKTKSLKKCDILAYGIYEGLNILDICCNPLDISSLCEAKFDSILRTEKILKNPVKLSPPSCFVSKICSCFNIPYHIEREVLQKVVKLQESHFIRAETLVGACIFFCLQDIPKEEKLTLGLSKINISHISKTLDVSEGSLYRTLKYM